MAARSDRPLSSRFRPFSLAPAKDGPLTPFIKWPGGKRQLLAHLVPRAPSRYTRYLEPFLGGGALYFALGPNRAVLGDLNAELVLAYRVVRDDVDGLIKALAVHFYDHDHYYEVRSLDPGKLTPAAAAARFIFLNKTGYNGLYRVNKRGQFNVPFGRYKTPPRLYDEDNLRGASRLLKGADIVRADYLDTLGRAEKDDFVYLDPPYQPVSASANFTRYTKFGFGEEDQRRLAEEFRRLDKLGCAVMLSNSDAPLIENLYKGYQLDRVPATRLINSDTNGRLGVMEIIVRNYV